MGFFGWYLYILYAVNSEDTYFHLCMICTEFLPSALLLYHYCLVCRGHLKHTDSKYIIISDLYWKDTEGTIADTILKTRGWTVSTVSISNSREGLPFQTWGEKTLEITRLATTSICVNMLSIKESGRYSVDHPWRNTNALTFQGQFLGDEAIVWENWCQGPKCTSRL